MRVLIAAKFRYDGRRRVGGVQSWGRAVRDQLHYRGHEVVMFEKGDRAPEGKFDVGILSNWSLTGHLRNQCETLVNVTHGIIPAEEPGHPNVVCTSEGVRNHWRLDGAPIVRQPINTDFWKPLKNAVRTHFVRFSYRSGLDFAVHVAEDLGLPYTHARNVPHTRLVSVLQRSACVLATGRAALEAIACGAPTVIVDHRRSYQGQLMDTRALQYAMMDNYSGRGGFEPTTPTLLAECEYRIAEGSRRSHVLQNHKASAIVDQLLEHAK